MDSCSKFPTYPSPCAYLLDSNICYTSLYIQSISPWSSPLPSVGDHHPQWLGYSPKTSWLVNLPPQHTLMIMAYENPYCFPWIKAGYKTNYISGGYLGGGFKYFLFSPLFWGRFPFWRAYFSNGLKPPTSSGGYVRWSVDGHHTGRLQRLQHGAGANFDLQGPISGRSSSRLRAGKSPNARRWKPNPGGSGSFQVTRRINRKTYMGNKNGPEKMSWWNRWKIREPYMKDGIAS